MRRDRALGHMSGHVARFRLRALFIRPVPMKKLVDAKPYGASWIRFMQQPLPPNIPTDLFSIAWNIAPIDCAPIKHRASNPSNLMP